MIELKEIKKLKDPIVMHSNVTLLARKNPKLKNKLVPFLLKNLNTSCLYIPTFSLDITEKDIFNINSIPYKMGNLSKEIIKYRVKRKYFRTSNPMHSYAYTNNKFLPNLSKIDTKSFGLDTIFDYFYRKNFNWVCFGADPNNGFSIFHHCEALMRVKYRKKLILKRKVINPYNSKIFEINYEYYARKENIIMDFKNAVSDLVKDNIIKIFKYGSFLIYIGECKDIVNYVCNGIKNDQYYLVNIS